jgi:predicted nucleic acid-binding Zn ribbon protein
MVTSVEAYLLELWDQSICPNCGKAIPEGTRVGSGRKSEGGFCSLDCYANFYQLALAERARRLAERVERKES